MFSRFFIDRPIFAAVLSIFIALAGLAALRVLPIAQYPEISPPVVSVTAIYPSASAQVLESTVAAPWKRRRIPRIPANSAVANFASPRRWSSRK